MNPVIARHFDAVEIRLIQCPLVATYQIARREIGPADGKLRLKATLNDGGLIELFEYVLEEGGEIHLSKYRFHWQDAQGSLKQRWDNAPHYPDLPNAPHHVHHENETVQHLSKVPDIFSIIDEVEMALSKR